MVEYIVEDLEKGGTRSGALGDYLKVCETLDARAWELALLPPNQAKVKERDKRATALELARLIFTELLSLDTGGPIQIYFPRNPKWRLYADVRVDSDDSGETYEPVPEDKLEVVFEIFGLKVVK